MLEILLFLVVLQLVLISSFVLVIVLLKIFGIFGIAVHFRVSFVQFQSYSNHNPRSHILKFLFFVIWIVFNFGNLPFYK